MAVLKTAKERMTRRTNYTRKRPPSRDSQLTPNYANQVQQKSIQAAELPLPTFVNVFRQNIEINSLDLDQKIETPEEVAPNAITAERAPLVGLSGQETSQIYFFEEQPSEEQVIETGLRASVDADLVTCRRQPKHSNPQEQPMLAFDQVLADLETKLLQQYRLLQGILIQILKRDWIATPKFNLCSLISIYDMIYKVNMT
ncbi:MAG: hypothetical protein EZS28_016050 [Streblomastix strix]|uniref:Uncharacterized protein n=1 Tax=Streblomastix strix TaxID=222440 RepID=A0A5J4W0L8_9EUKA|nr:MAG: hypothetical protein EZS28_016050 [Streblomastix strix]